MKYAPHLLGALAITLVAGAVGGAAIGDIGMVQRGHTETLPQNAVVTTGNAALAKAERQPDQYPLVTPEGTVEVAELSLRGRMRDHGYDGWWEAREEAQYESAEDYDFYATASPERIAHEERLLAFTDGRPEAGDAAQQAQPRSRAEAPLALAEPEAVTTANNPAPAASTGSSPAAPNAIGNSKMVDISAALSSR